MVAMEDWDLASNPPTPFLDYLWNEITRSFARGRAIFLYPESCTVAFEFRLLF